MVDDLPLAGSYGENMRSVPADFSGEARTLSVMYLPQAKSTSFILAAGDKNTAGFFLTSCRTKNPPGDTEIMLSGVKIKRGCFQFYLNFTMAMPSNQFKDILVIYSQAYTVKKVLWYSQPQPGCH